MARWWLSRKEQQQEVARLTNRNSSPSALTAAATLLGPARERLTLQYDTWQRESWDFYDNLGEFRYGVEWRGNSISRARLRAGQIEPGQDEPTIVETGIAAELVAELSENIGGRSQLLKRFSELLSVVGEGILIGEERPEVGQVWDVRSVDEVRSKGRGIVEVIDADESTFGNEKWRRLSGEYLIGRVWKPHARLKYLADCPARAALPTMRELELVNRHIQAQYLSRLASAGVVIFPEEVTFPVREEFQDAPDPFIREWIETAREAIKTPGTAAAVVPIPMRLPGEYIDKIQHIDFTMKLDERIIEKRESTIRRLATELDMPTEILLGLGDVNHWSAWQIDESGVKVHIAPVIETICHGLTVTYLHPRLKAAGESPNKWAIWYDPSELVQRPDKSKNAIEVYDRMELSGEALRRQTGFNEDDLPTIEEVKEIALKILSRNPQVGLTALGELVGEKMPIPPGESEEERTRPVEPDDDPKKPEEERPDSQAPERSKVASLINQPLTEKEVFGHYVSIEMGGRWNVLHPSSCGPNTASCPITWAVFRHKDIGPGMHGRYALQLVNEKISLGERTFVIGEVSSSQVK